MDEMLPSTRDRTIHPGSATNRACTLDLTDRSLRDA
jgi:hypothetical protein